MDAVIGLDLGTSGIKALLVSSEGKVLFSINKKYPLLTPNPGWAEQDPNMWWKATREALIDLTRFTFDKKISVLSIGLSGQMNGLVFLDKSLNLVRPCIIWADARTAKQCDKINQLLGIERLAFITGKIAVTGYTAPKILWVQDNEPHLFDACRHLLLPKDYIRLKLTEEICTDYSDASNTVLFDINSHEWSDDIVNTLGLDRSMLPPALPSLTTTGVVTQKIAQETGLKHGIPVIAGAGDSSAEIIGSGITKEGDILSVIGSSGNISTICNQPLVDKNCRIHTGCHVLSEQWIMTGVQQAAGLSIRWLLENLKIDIVLLQNESGQEPYKKLFDQALQIAPGSEGLVFLPYLVGERTPHLDPDARGVFFGIGMHHTYRHFIRAVLEGIAFSQREAVEILYSLGLTAENVVASGRGQNKVMRQILADVLRIPVITNANDNGAAYGAALLAAVNAGIFENIEVACKKMINLKNLNKPQLENQDRYNPSYEVFRDLYLKLRPVFKKAAFLMSDIQPV